MNLLQKTTTAFFFSFAISSVVSAQQIYNLDLESSIELAKEKSKTMLILQQSLRKASDDRNVQISSSIGLRQPIEAFFGYNQIRLGYKQAKLAYDLSLKQLKREELNLVYDISQTFFTLLSYHERLNIALLSLNKQQEAFTIAQNKYSAGLIREVEALHEIQIELSQMEIKKRKAEGMINGDIMVNYNFIGVDKSKLIIPLETSLNNTWQNLINRPGSFGVGLTVNIPILDWGENRAKVHGAQATLTQNQYRFDAEKSFEISRQRYVNGDIDSQSMALERERLNNAYISRLESFINYKLLLSDLMRKTFFDFEKNISMLGK